jgi:hypothetical protein
LALAPPDWTVGPQLAADGPTVALAWPVDARAPFERTELGRYYAYNLPAAVYGDANLGPDPLALVDRSLTAGLPAMGVPLTSWEDADYRVRVFVLDHVGTRDVSDANWVSTATGGIAGTLGKFVTPAFAMVEARLRLEVRRRDGSLVVVRDIAAFRVEKRELAATWAYWSLLQRNIHAEMFTRAFRGVEADLARDAALVIDQARHGEPVVAGLAPDHPVYASLREWNRPDTLQYGPVVDPWDHAVAMAKYGQERFSVASGWAADRGELVGRLGFPANNLGYDLGVAEGAQILLDLTVFGRINSAGAGQRARVVQSGRWAARVELRAAGDAVLLDEAPKGRFFGDWNPRFAGTTTQGAALLSARFGALTPYTRVGGAFVYRREAVGSGLLPTLDAGQALGFLGAPGLELQIGPVVAVALEASAHVWDTGEADLTPQVTVGLR